MTTFEQQLQVLYDISRQRREMWTQVYLEAFKASMDFPMTQDAARKFAETSADEAMEKYDARFK